MKESGGKRPPKRDSGCGTTAIIIVLVIIVLCVFGSCGSNKQRSTSSVSYNGIDKDWLEDMRHEAINNVRRTRGKVRFEEILDGYYDD